MNTKNSCTDSNSSPQSFWSKKSPEKQTEIRFGEAAENPREFLGEEFIASL